jgi:hypothetical protein
MNVPRQVICFCFFLGVICAPVQAQKNKTPSTCAPRYVGELVLGVEGDGRLMRLKQPYTFVDSACRKWIAPKGTLVDGASIPGALWSIIGGPFEGPYRNASVLHDWYCITRTMPWRDVHRMFFEGMIASGVPRIQAQILYGAVYLGGPRWDQMTVANAKLAYANIPGAKGGASTPAVREAQRLGKVNLRTKLSPAGADLDDNLLEQLSMQLDGKTLSIAEIETLVDKIGQR